MLIQERFVPADLCRELIAAFQEVSDTYGAGDKYVRRWPYRNSISGIILKRRAADGLSAALTELRQRAADEVCRYFRVEGAAFIDFTLFTEMMFGDYHSLHADNEALDVNGVWAPNHTSFHHCAAVLYLNACGQDYQGGLVRVPSFDLEVAPQTGLLLGFLCGREYQHEVTTIQEGRRYTIAIWITRDPRHAERWS